MNTQYPINSKKQSATNAKKNKKATKEEKDCIAAHIKGNERATERGHCESLGFSRGIVLLHYWPGSLYWVHCRVDVHNQFLIF